MCDVADDIHFRDGTGLRRLVNAIARAASRPGAPARPSTIYRALLDEALTARGTDCATGHRGPFGTGSCGWCGGSSSTVRSLTPTERLTATAEQLTRMEHDLVQGDGPVKRGTLQRHIDMIRAILHHGSPT